MIRKLKGFFFLLLWALWVTPSSGAELAIRPTDRLLILAPHPDDDILCCGGVIQDAVDKHVPIQIVFLTYGDNNAWAFTLSQYHPVFRPNTMLRMGETRRDEALAATRRLGVSPEQLVFLGYPDFGTLSIWNAHWGDALPYKSRMTRVLAVPYPTALRPETPYKGEEILRDLKSAIQTFHPTKIFVPHPRDSQSDHRALHLFTRLALWDLASEDTPQVYYYLIHFPGWPTQRGLHQGDPLNPPATLPDQTWLLESLTTHQVEQKYEALKAHQTQWAYSHRSMMSYVRSNELFGNASLAKSPPDVENWQVHIDSTELLLSGRLTRAHSASTDVVIAALGYRRDTPMERMSKIFVRLGAGSARVYDQDQHLRDSGIVSWRDHRQFSVRLPLRTLGYPEKVLAGCEIPRGHERFNWDFWQIFECPYTRSVPPSAAMPFCAPSHRGC